MNMRDYSIVHLDIYYYKGTAQLVHAVGNGIDVETACSKKIYRLNEHEGLFNSTLRHILQ